MTLRAEVHDLWMELPTRAVLAQALNPAAKASMNNGRRNQRIANPGI
jgi:hypothetical protein